MGPSMIAWTNDVRMNEVNGRLFTNPIVVYDFRNNGDMTRMRTRFEQYDYVCLVRRNLRVGQNIPLPTSTKREKFESD